VLKDWNPSNPNSHLAGGMTYQDGELTVPTPGRYYIYAQHYYFNSGRVIVRVNGKRITIVQPPTRGSDQGVLHAGGVFILKAGDVITLTPDPPPEFTCRLITLTLAPFWFEHVYCCMATATLPYELKGYEAKSFFTCSVYAVIWNAVFFQNSLR